MILVRMMLAAMAAVGLSIGGYELGAKQGPPSSATTIDAPEDHPLSVALKTPVGQAMTPAERDQLVKLEVNLKSDEEHAKSDALLESAKVVYGLQNNNNAWVSDQEILQRLESRLKQMREEYNASAPEVKDLEQQIAVQIKRLNERRRKEIYRNAFETHRDTAVDQDKFIDLRRDVEKQLTQQKMDTVYRKYQTMAFQQMTPKVSEKVKEVVASRRDMNEEKGFGLLVALRNRDDLKLTPQQVTKLQFLQADFIRRFAPIREAYETRVDNLKWRYESQVKSLYLKAAPAKATSKTQEVEVQYFVETPSKTKGDKTVSYWINSTAKQKSSNKTQSEFLWTYPKKKSDGIVIRYFAWASDESLEAQLKSLKSEIDDKAKKLLSTPQRQLLQEKIDQSLAAGK